MRQVCISSTVLNDHITWNVPSIKIINGLKLHFVDQDVPFWPISISELDVLVNELEDLIERFVLDREIAENKEFSIKYKKVYYELNLRNDFDWYIAFLIDLYNIALKTAEHKSCLYVFNKEILKAYDSESIIAYLRTNIWINASELYTGINALWKELRLDKQIDIETIQRGLAHLISHGLVYHDSKRDQYSVTAIGYMYW